MGRKRKRRKAQLKKSLVFELYGLILLAVALIGLVRPGAVGRALNGVFRFFAGNWDFLIPLSLLVLAVYIMWKRTWEISWSHRSAGIVILCLFMLAMSHYKLVYNASNGGQIQELSTLGLTWELYKEDMSMSSDDSAQGIDEGKPDLGGGMIGAILFGFLHTMFGQVGTLLLLSIILLIGILLTTGRSYMDIILGVKKRIGSTIAWVSSKREATREMWDQLKEEEEKEREKEHEQTATPTTAEGDTVQVKEEAPTVDTHTETLQPESVPSNDQEPSPVIHDFTDVAYQTDQEDPEAHDVSLEAGQDTKNTNEAFILHTEQGTSDTTGFEGDKDSSGGLVAYADEEQNYQLPPFSILKKQSRKNITEKKGLASNAAKLEQTLQSFGVNVKVTNVHRGPAVTRYEVLPDVGVKVSRIVSLTDDIALALAAKGIRLEAPIPGKSAIGIEVPNEDVSMVTLREVLESSQYHESPSKLTIALGRDISGEPIVAHLNKMPHLLVAGATGSGKSVCINGIISSVLYKAKPQEVKLMLIDPKMVELNTYNGIPHLLTPVVTDTRKAAVALKKVVGEMERRYDQFSQMGTRDIERYNEVIQKQNAKNPENKQPLLPYIVVIVDELADLMMVAPGDVEDAICRLAQMARAAGIHLIIATQRPSVDVITGVIKANIPSRIAFGVSSQADSRTILDMGGAEKLLGRGDMLFMPVGASKPMRVQGAFLSDEEVDEIVSYCIGQQKAEYHEEMTPSESEEKNNDPSEIEDDLYQDAVDLVVNQGTASVSMLQRRFRIGYTRAARLIDAMEAKGVVGPYEGSKPREVLLTKDESHIS
ncbi:DNA translocase FtsK 4TM domain-containing protein [Caldalkalibacillus salinus]|uniref:DNA translocase FtsK 4TM domain-containing protein n=1 Tax=Caldalkalibacillus salinus TaxID=2803787 RepID=UPI00192515A4